MRKIRTCIAVAFAATGAAVESYGRLLFGIALLAGLLAISPPAHAQQSGSSPSAAEADTSDAPRTYTVRDDDTLYNISRRFGTSVRQLMEWNDLDTPDIKIGQTLQIRPQNEDAGTGPDKSTSPDAGVGSDASTSTDESVEPTNRTNAGQDTGRGDTQDTANPSRADRSSPDNRSATSASPSADAPRRSARDGAARDGAARDGAARDGAARDGSARDAPARRRTPPGTVQAESDDTFVDIAIRYGTTADTLFALNDRLREPLPPGRIIQLPERFGPPTHVVEAGDTMYSIAGDYGVSVRALRDANNLQNASIQPGQTLRIPGRAPSTSSASPTPRPDTTGTVALYPPAFEGRLTASGATYRPNTFTGSHPSLPYGSVVLLSHPGTRKHCFVEIIDRGPLEEDVLMDVSDAVARELGLSPGTRTSLQLRVVWVEQQ